MEQGSVMHLFLKTFQNGLPKCRTTGVRSYRIVSDPGVSNTNGARALCSHAVLLFLIRTPFPLKM